MISPGAWGVAVVSRSAARLFRRGPGALVEFVAVNDEVHSRHAQGGWSQACFQRGIEEKVAVHVRRVANRLRRAHLRRPFEHLATVASSELRPVIEDSLHGALAELLTGTIDADVEHATADERGLTVSPVAERAQQARERPLVARLEQALGTGGASAARLDEVLPMLDQRRVDALLIPEGSSLRAGLCPTGGRLSTTDDGRCPLDGAVLDEVDEVDEVEHAVGRGRVDRPRCAPRGQMAYPAR
jgi:peptide subunit release factor 1 (eRF1)